MASTPSNGILLYPGPSLHPFPHMPSMNSLSSSSSTASFSKTTTKQHNSMPTTPQRKIRFAPLPDPRRSVLVTDDGSELPFPDEITSIPCPPVLAELGALSKSKPAFFDITTIPHDPDTESLDSNSTRRSSSNTSRGADSSATTPTASASDSVSSFTPDSPFSVKTTLPPIPNPLLTAKLQKHYDEKHSSIDSSDSTPRSWVSKPRSLLRPFLRRPQSSSASLPTLSSTASAHSPNLSSASSSTSTLHPHAKHISNNAPFPRINLSSPSLGLFRLGSRHSHRSSDNDGYVDGKGSSSGSLKGFTQRWTGSSSSLSNSKHHHHHHHHNYTPQTYPLARTQSIASIQSTQSGTQTPFGSTASLPITRTGSNSLSVFSRSSPSTTSLTQRRPSTATGASSTTSLNSSLSSSAAPTSPARKGKGTRMLNGRVYGHKRNTSHPNANPFANARDEADPEFVEWGYGGMGSVRNGAAVGSRVWGRLQREGAVLGGADDGGGAGGKSAGGGEDGGELDDGSGMGWVRKRREQREKEKREKEERERREKEELSTIVEGEVVGEKHEAHDEDANKANDAQVEKTEEIEQVKDRPSTATTITPTAATPTSFSSSEAEVKSRPATAGSVATFTLHTPVNGGMEEKDKDNERERDDDEHMTRAVKVPAPAPALGRRHSHGRNHSRESVPDGEVVHEEERDGVVKVVDEKLKEEESESEEEEEEEGSRDGEDEEEESESEEEEEDAKRKTAVGAGVEKISRHK